MVEGSELITPDNYLGFVSIIINEIFGSPVLFLLVGLILIAYIGTVNNISTINLIAISTIFIMVTLTLYYQSLWLALVLLIIGVLAYTGYNRWIQKQS